jgi:hypothetical protein
VVEAAEHGEVLAAGEDLVDGGVLAREPDPVPDLLCLAHHVEARNLGPPTVGPEQRRQHPHRRRLPRAVRAQQPANGPFAHLQIQPVQRRRLAVPLEQPLATTADPAKPDASLTHYTV